MSNITIKDASIFRQTLKDTLLFAGTDQRRPVLTAIELATTATGFELRATDSYALMVAEVDAEVSEPIESAIIPADFVKQLIAAIPNKHAYDLQLTLTIIGTAITAALPTATITGTLMDSQYPKVTEILANAKKEPGELANVGLGAKLLSKLSKVAAPADKTETGTPLRFTMGETPLKPVLVTWPKANHYLVLVMPVRISEVAA